MTKNTTAIKETQHSTNAPSKEITGFVPTQDELIHLLKHWVKKAVDERFFVFGCQCYGSYDLERNRINEIAQILGDEETDRAVKKAYEEAAQDFDKSDWIVFRYGTQKERTAYQDKRLEKIHEPRSCPPKNFHARPGHLSLGVLRRPV